MHEPGDSHRASCARTRRRPGLFPGLCALLNTIPHNGCPGARPDPDPDARGFSEKQWWETACQWAEGAAGGLDLGAGAGEITDPGPRPQRGPGRVGGDAQPRLQPGLQPALQPGSLGAIVGNFKSVTTRRINRLRGTPGIPIWQRNCWELIIRSDASLNQIPAYIRDNPGGWSEDRLHPDTARRKGSGIPRPSRSGERVPSAARLSMAEAVAGDPAYSSVQPCIR
jgi:hypothetical protein